MEQYIKKSALVAEIKRRYETNLICAHSAFKNGKVEALREVKDFLDTLEVKEVDLEKEIDLVEDKYYGFESLSRADIIDVAKHFFELALSLKNS